MKNRTVLYALALGACLAAGAASPAIAANATRAETDALGEAASAPGVGKAPKPVADIRCDVTVEDKYGTLIPHGGSVGNTRFPLKIEMRVTNAGTTPVPTVTNRYIVRHDKRGVIMPLTTDTHDLPPGAVALRTQSVQLSDIDLGGDGKDPIDVTVETDVDDLYAPPAGSKLPSTCKHTVVAWDEPK